MSLYDNINTKNILVIGDVILDVYFHGDVERISPEAPVPVFRKISECNVLGGAGNVAVNLQAANQKTTVMTVLGNDEAGDIIIQKMEEYGIHSRLVLRDKRKTVVKTRLIAGNGQQMIRLDTENTEDISAKMEDQLLALLKTEISRYDLIILSDYMKGLLTHSFTQKVIDMANELGIKVLVDVKDKDVDKYSHAYLLKPNQHELGQLTGLPTDTIEKLETAAKKLRERCECAYVLTTCGGQGMVLSNDDAHQLIPASKQEVFDVTGAGDTAIAYLAAALANKLPIGNAVAVSNCAAGLQVSKRGTSAVYLSEVSRSMVNVTENLSGKLLDRDSASRLRITYPNKRIVFTNGCFDILHIGHIRSLRQAAGQGDLLVVGLNSNCSVKAIKGDERPINDEQDRAEMLCALSFVDYVVIFDENTPYELIKSIQPDVLAKGGDYKPEDIVGRDIVEKRGGKLVLLDYIAGRSTTKIIHGLQEYGSDIR